MPSLSSTWQIQIPALWVCAHQFYLKLIDYIHALPTANENSFCGRHGYTQPAQLVRVTGLAPLHATVYELERLRCGDCRAVFTGTEPEDVGPEKNDEIAGTMMAELKYGAGMPLNRLKHLEQRLGVPLPAATQWEMVEGVADLLKPARDELIQQASQG